MDINRPSSRSTAINSTFRHVDFAHNDAENNDAINDHNTTTNVACVVGNPSIHPSIHLHSTGDLRYYITVNGTNRRWHGLERRGRIVGHEGCVNKAKKNKTEKNNIRQWCLSLGVARESRGRWEMW